MGCIHSRNDNISDNTHKFRVQNIDDAGNPLWTGQLELTRTELILYRKSKQATRWPLRCLRRYGFHAEKDLFSFESGRHCATGSGIYAFRSLDQSAEILFNTLKNYIQTQATEEFNPAPNENTSNSSNHPNHSLDRNGRLSPNNLHNGSATCAINDTPNQNVSPNPRRSTDTLNAEGCYIEPDVNRHSNLTAGNPSSPLMISSLGSDPMSPTVASPGSMSSIDELTIFNSPHSSSNNRMIQNDYQDCNIVKESLDRPPPEKAPPVTNIEDAVDNQSYINSGLLLNNIKSTKQLATETEPTSPTIDTTSHNYANIRVGEERKISNDSKHPYENLEIENWNTGRRPRSSKPEIFHNDSFIEKSEPSTPTSNNEMNYIVIDVNKSSNPNLPIATKVPVQIPQETCRTGRGYAEIDFEKTDALNTLHKSTSLANEASRTTRHDTIHINNAHPPYKQSNSISD